MKKKVISICCAIALILLLLSLVGCSALSFEGGVPKEKTEFTTHEVKVNTAESFWHYFSLSHTPTFKNYYAGSQTTYPFSSIYKTRATSTLSLTPYLGFVEYSGYVIFSVYTSESVDKQIKSNRRIELDSDGWVDEMIVESDTSNDSSIDFRKVEYRFLESDITITYHDEGLSGTPALSYETIELTNYNYGAYLQLSTSTEYEYDQNNNQILYKRYNISKKVSVTEPFEFRDVYITFSNGKKVYLNAIGGASFRVDAEASLFIVNVEGYIDYYPPAIYSY